MSKWKLSTLSTKARFKGMNDTEKKFKVIDAFQEVRNIYIYI